MQPVPQSRAEWKENCRDHSLGTALTKARLQFYLCGSTGIVLVICLELINHLARSSLELVYYPLSIVLLESRHRGLCHLVMAQTRKTAFSTVISSILEENRYSGTRLTVLSPEGTIEGPNRLISIPPKRLPTMYLSPTPCTSQIYRLMCRGCTAVILHEAVSRRLTSKTTSGYPRSRINPGRVNNSQRLTFDIPWVLLCSPSSAIPLRITIPPIQSTRSSYGGLAVGPSESPLRCICYTFRHRDL